MILAPDQIKMFWRLWSQACQANRWTRENGMSGSDIDAKRKEILIECGFKSLTLVDRTDGFTKVKNKLLILIGVSVKAGVEDQDPTENKARTQRYVIEKEIIPCLALYEEDTTGYVATVIAGLIRHYKTDRPERPPTLSDLSTKPSFKKVGAKWEKGPSQMKQALMTLSQRLNDKRKAAGDSIHDMKIKAGIPCDCRQCIRRQFTREEVTADDGLVEAGEPNWNV